MPKYSAPIVGARHHPPGLALISNLRAGTPLFLESEPDNPWDVYAIKVMISADDIPADEELQNACAAQGVTPDDLYAQAWQLGYVDQKQFGTKSATLFTPMMPRFAGAQLKFDGIGRAMVEAEFHSELVSESGEES